MGVTFGGKTCLEPVGIWRQCLARGQPTDSWFGRANSVQCPLGHEPGYGLFLMRLADLQALNASFGYNIVFADDQDPAGTAVTLKNYSVVRSWGVTPGARNDPNAAVAVEVADVRHKLRAEVLIDRAYNVRSSAGGPFWLTPTINAATGLPWTWDEMGHDLWQYCGSAVSAGAWPGLPYTPVAANPENFAFFHWYTWDALCHFLGKLACAMRLDPTQDHFSIVRVGDDDGAPDAALYAYDGRRVWDGYTDEPLYAALPQYVRVLFPREPPPLDGTDPYYAVDVRPAPDLSPGPPPTAHNRGTVVIHDETPFWSYGGADNITALNAIAAERADNYLRAVWRGGAALDVTLRGPLNNAGLLPGRRMKLAGWEQRGDGVKTAVHRGQDVWSPTLRAAGYGRPPEENYVVLTSGATIPPGGSDTCTVLDASYASTGRTIVVHNPSQGQTIVGAKRAIAVWVGSAGRFYGVFDC